MASKVETELASIAQERGLTLVRHSGQPYHLRTWDGRTIGPFKGAREVKVWLAGYSQGQADHAPGCTCGRVACNHRNAVRRYLVRSKVGP